MITNSAVETSKKSEVKFTKLFAGTVESKADHPISLWTQEEWRRHKQRVASRTRQQSSGIGKRTEQPPLNMTKPKAYNINEVQAFMAEQKAKRQEAIRLEKLKLDAQKQKIQAQLQKVQTDAKEIAAISAPTITGPVKNIEKVASQTESLEETKSASVHPEKAIQCDLQEKRQKRKKKGDELASLLRKAIEECDEVSSSISERSQRLEKRSITKNDRIASLNQMANRLKSTLDTQKRPAPISNTSDLSVEDLIARMNAFLPDNKRVDSEKIIPKPLQAPVTQPYVSFSARKHMAATRIQSVYRGYRVRKLTGALLRRKHQNLVGKSVNWKEVRAKLNEKITCEIKLPKYEIDPRITTSLQPVVRLAETGDLAEYLQSPSCTAPKNKFRAKKKCQKLQQKNSVQRVVPHVAKNLVPHTRVSASGTNIHTNLQVCSPQILSNIQASSPLIPISVQAGITHIPTDFRLSQNITSVPACSPNVLNDISLSSSHITSVLANSSHVPASCPNAPTNISICSPVVSDIPVCSPVVSEASLINLMNFKLTTTQNVSEGLNTLSQSTDISLIASEASDNSFLHNTTSKSFVPHHHMVLGPSELSQRVHNEMMIQDSYDMALSHLKNVENMRNLSYTYDECAQLKRTLNVSHATVQTSPPHNIDVPFEPHSGSSVNTEYSMQFENTSQSNCPVQVIEDPTEDPSVSYDMELKPTHTSSSIQTITQVNVTTTPTVDTVYTQSFEQDSSCESVRSVSQQSDSASSVSNTSLDKSTSKPVLKGALLSTLTLMDSLQKEEELRYKHQKALFQMQEHLLVEEAKAKLASIQTEGGTNVRKRQRAVLVQLRDQRCHIRRLLETQHLAVKQRRLIFKQQQLLSEAIKSRNESPVTPNNQTLIESPQGSSTNESIGSCDAQKTSISEEVIESSKESIDHSSVSQSTVIKSCEQADTQENKVVNVPSKPKLNLKMSLSPRPRRNNRRCSSESDDSFTLSQTETTSDLSDGEGKLVALMEELSMRKAEAEKLHKEKRRLRQERLASQTQALEKQIAAYDNYILQAKLHLQQERQQADSIVKPVIKKPQNANRKTVPLSPRTLSQKETDTSANESTSDKSDVWDKDGRGDNIELDCSGMSIVEKLSLEMASSEDTTQPTSTEELCKSKLDIYIPGDETLHESKDQSSEESYVSVLVDETSDDDQIKQLSQHLLQSLLTEALETMTSLVKKKQVESISGKVEGDAEVQLNAGNLLHAQPIIVTEVASSAVNQEDSKELLDRKSPTETNQTALDATLEEVLLTRLSKQNKVVIQNELTSRLLNVQSTSDSYFNEAINDEFNVQSHGGSWFDDTFWSQPPIELESADQAATLKQLQELKEKYPDLVLRQVPNKPPPPYTPPKSTSIVTPVTPTAPVVPLQSIVIPPVQQDQPKPIFAYQKVPTSPVFSIPSGEGEVTSILDLYTTYIYGQWKSGCSPMSIKASPFNLDIECDLDQNEMNKRIFHQLLFDLVKQLIHSIDEHNLCTKVPLDPWIGRQIESNERVFFGVEIDNEKSVLKFVQRQSRIILGYEQRLQRESAISKWAQKRRDHVDKILVQEVTAEEPTWTQYEVPEVSVKNKISEEIFESLLEETVQLVDKLVSNKYSKNIT